jgi:hypothetical protein
MHLLPWLLSFVFPRCASLGSSGLYEYHDFGVNPARIKFIALPLQQKVSD